MKVGCTAIFQNQELLKRLPNESSIYHTEVTATELAMNIKANHKSSKFIIHSDPKAVFQALHQLLSCARGVVVIAVGNEHSDTSSYPGRYWLHST